MGLYLPLGMVVWFTEVQEASLEHCLLFVVAFGRRLHLGRGLWSCVLSVGLLLVSLL